MTERVHKRLTVDEVKKPERYLKKEITVWLYRLCWELRRPNCST